MGENDCALPLPQGSNRSVPLQPSSWQIQLKSTVAKTSTLPVGEVELLRRQNPAGLRSSNA
jgi:hypothetical protein